MTGRNSSSRVFIETKGQAAPAHDKSGSAVVMTVKYSTCKKFSVDFFLTQYVHSFFHFIMYSAFPIFMVNIFSVSGSTVYERQLCVQIFKIQWISSSKLVPFLMFTFNHPEANFRNLSRFSIPAFLFLPSYSLQNLWKLSSLPYGGPHEHPYGVWTELSSLPESIPIGFLNRGSTSATVGSHLRDGSVHWENLLLESSRLIV